MPSMRIFSIVMGRPTLRGMIPNVLAIHIQNLLGLRGRREKS